MLIREARPEDAAGIARVHIASWRTTYRGIVPQEYLDALSVEARTRRWARSLAEPAERTCTFVAETEAGEVIGFANSGPAQAPDPDYPGELYAIYLFQEHQRRGIGRQLMGRVAERLALDGFPTMLLWVLAANPARRFYEVVGGVELRTHSIEIGGATLEEVAYGWADTAALARALAG